MVTGRSWGRIGRSGDTGYVHSLAVNSVDEVFATASCLECSDGPIEELGGVWRLSLHAASPERVSGTEVIQRPLGTAMDGDDSLYVSDVGGAIYRVNRHGEVELWFEGDLLEPRAGSESGIGPIDVAQERSWGSITASESWFRSRSMPMARPANRNRLRRSRAVFLTAKIPCSFRVSVVSRHRS